MRIEVLQAFVTAAEQRSFSKAADMLYLSQPTVSRYIREFEKQLGEELFVRNTHTCELTLIGQQAFTYARRIVNEWNCIEKLASSHADRQKNTIKIGYTYRDMLRFITLALSYRTLNNQKLELSVQCSTGEEVSRLVREGRLNCAVMHFASLDNPDGLNIRLIKKCTVCAIVSQSHYLAGYESVELAQLIHETDVRYKSEKHYYSVIDEAFAGLNLPQLKHEYVENEVDCMPAICHRNVISYSTDLYEEWPGCRAIPIRDFTMDFSLVFVTKAGEVSQSIEQLYKALCSSFP